MDANYGVSSGIGINNNKNYQDRNQQHHELQFRPQNEYIEVVNLPSGGGGQSVEYTPPARHVPSVVSIPGVGGGDDSNLKQTGQNNAQFYSFNSGEVSSLENQGQFPESYSPAAPLHHTNILKQAGQTSTGGLSTIEYLDGGSIQPIFNPNSNDNDKPSGEREVVTLNNYKQTVSSLDPKTLVELIAKQVPSLKDVLSPAVDGSSSSSSSPSASKDSYEIIDMPPKYHVSSSEGNAQTIPSGPSLEENYYSNSGGSPSSDQHPDYSPASDTKDYVDAQGQASTGEAITSSVTDQVTTKNNKDLQETSSQDQNQKQISPHDQGSSSNIKDKDKYGQRLTSSSSDTHVYGKTEPLPVTRLKVQRVNGLLFEPSTNAEVKTDFIFNLLSFV